MEKIKNIKNMFSTRDDINSIIKISIRLGISGIIILIIIIIWSYLIYKVSKPYVVNQDNSLLDILANPYQLYCNAQLNPDPSDSAQNSDREQNISCPNNKVVYTCDGLSQSYPVDYEIPEDICISSKEINTDNYWCDTGGLNDINPDGSVSNILRDKIIFNCCIDRETESNINYTGLIIYILTTVPIIYMLIDKIFNKFIFIDNTKNEGKQFNTLINAIMDGIGTKLLVFIIIVYFFILPIFRYFFVSYKCENVSIDSQDTNCNKVCTNNEDCATLNNSSACSSCINGLCSNPDFSDGDIDVNPSGLSISVCGIKSILEHLKPQEIDDIYNKFLLPLNPSVSISIDEKKTAIQDHLIANQSDNIKFTSYYYRFYPRQEIIVNDTLTPFRIRIPNPSIDGYDYLLNNFIQLEEYTDPNDLNCQDIEANKDPTNNSINELTCNNNHNCKWNQSNNTCENNSDCPDDRYKLPIIDAISAHQTMGDSLVLHNKVIRPGNNYDESSDSYPDNLYPCNDVVFSNNLKIQAKNDITTNKPIADMDDWINHFELKRDECSDKMGQCYLKDYVCENNRGYPIPLKNLQLGSTTDFTIGSMSDLGCQKALYPCAESDLDSECMTIEEDTSGYIIEKNNGGICKKVYWNPSTNSWDILDNNPNTSGLPESNKCIPSSIVDSGNVINPIFTDATISNWIKNNSDVTTHCKSVYNMPRSNIDDDTTINNYYRWNSVSNDNNILCFDWSNEGNNCPESKIINNLATFRQGEEPQVECCIDIMEQTGPINLYIEGTGEALPISGVEPTQIDP